MCVSIYIHIQFPKTIGYTNIAIENWIKLITCTDDEWNYLAYGRWKHSHETLVMIRILNDPNGSDAFLRYLIRSFLNLLCNFSLKNISTVSCRSLKQAVILQNVLIDSATLCRHADSIASLSSTARFATSELKRTVWRKFMAQN